MISKERMLASIAHEEPDRVPIGEWQFGREVVEPVIGEKAISFCGLNRAKALWEGRRDEVVAQWKKAVVATALRFGWDAVLVHLMIDRNTEIEAPEQTGADKWKYTHGAELTYSEDTDRLFITRPGEKSHAAPRPLPAADLVPTDSELEVVRHVVKELGKTHFIMGGSLSGHPALRFDDVSVNEVERWVKLYEDPEGWGRSYLNDVNSESFRLGLELARREGLDGIAYGCDYGCTKGPFMSPEMFRKAILPGLAACAQLVHRNGMIMLLHSCGNNTPLMDMIIEAGVDVYQSIQTEMDIIALKRRYGKNIALWGGVSAGTIVTGTPEAVRAEAIKFLQACKPGGGYIFGTSHSLMPGAKWENYQAMLAAHRQFGSYGN